MLKAQDIQEGFNKVQPLLNAIGDPTRQLILLVLMETKCSEGKRVGEITSRTHLSRPAVSHQLKILKDCGLVKIRQEGTKNYYYIDVATDKALLGNMKKLIADIEEYIVTLEDK